MHVLTYVPSASVSDRPSLEGQVLFSVPSEHFNSDDYNFVAIVRTGSCIKKSCTLPRVLHARPINKRPTANTSSKCHDYDTYV